MNRFRKFMLAVSLSAATSFAAGSSKISVLIVPQDKVAESSSLKIERYMNEALAEFQGVQVKSLDVLFGVTPDEDAEGALRRAETSYAEGQKAFEAKSFEDAEKKLRATIKEFHKAVAAMKGCAHLCDAVAMYASVLQSRGDAEEAKVALLDLMALGPTFELDRKKFPQEFIALRAQVAAGRSAHLRGSLTVKSKPLGARVLLDGEMQGFTPMTLSTLAVGKHLVKIERPGFKQYGVMVDITPEDAELSHDLSETQGYQAYAALLDKLGSEALSGKGGPTMQSIAKTFSLDRALVGVLRGEGSNGSELQVALFDLKSGKKLAGKRSNFQGEEYGQLKSELGRIVNALMTAAEGGTEKVVKSPDPLESRHGTEEWNADDKGGARTSREKKKKAGDPLDGVNGTEDW